MTSTAMDLSSPLTAPLQMFNLLPSRTLHPERARALWPEDVAHDDLLTNATMQRVLHKRRSAQLLHSIGADAAPVLGLGDAALPLALAEPELLEQVANFAGAALMGGHLRRTIERDKLAQARADLGDEIFLWARHQAFDIHPGLSDAQLQPWLHNRLSAGANALGFGLIAQVFGDAPAPTRLRAHWKLHPAAEAPELRNASGLKPKAARDLCLAVMQQLDSKWLSYFPAIH